MAFGVIKNSIKISDEVNYIKILLDTGASSSIINKQCVEGLKLDKSKVTEWRTSAGVFTTNKQVKLNLKLPEFFQNRIITYNVHVTENTSTYDMIMGRDMLQELGIQISFGTDSVTWDEVSIPMKPFHARIETDYHIDDSVAVKEATKRIKQILDAKYEPADLDEVVAQADHLTPDQRTKLRNLLEKYKDLFDGQLGYWKGEKYHIELQDNVKPYHAKPFSIPKAYEQTLKMELDRLVSLGVLKKVNRSQWAAPTFIIPKKDRTVRFISDFRELNKRIKRKPFPIPKIQDLLLKLEGFQYGTSLDLNMGYYHIELDLTSKALCTIVLPWGKYEYQRLPMGLCNSPDIFQEKMTSLMAGLEFVRAYIDDLLCITKGNWNDHLEKLEEIFKRLKKAGLKVNAKKSFFGRYELEYLGYWITRKGIQPIPKKVQAIQALQPPKTRKELRSLIGMINYYRDMWPKRSETLAPLSAMTSSKVKWQWTDVHQKAFEEIKRIITKETLLMYPNFNEIFEIHTDASKTQLGAVISQSGKPIAFYSRKLNPAQTRYTTTERELLAIVETLKEFRNILLGQQIKIYTDHKNLTYKTFNTDRVMRWRLILEEYNPTFYHIDGPKNVVADALSRLNMGANENDSLGDQKMSPQLIAEVYKTDESSDANLYPLKFKKIAKEQQQDKELIKTAKNNKEYHLKTYKVAGKEIPLLSYQNKIVIPKTLQKQVTQWYHTQLCHPGETRTEQTIRMNFTWKGLRETVHNICSKCHTCQLTKKSSKKYGHLPEKEAEATPWERLCVDLIGPYTLQTIEEDNRSTKSTLWAVTMIDPATGWFEVKQIQDKEPGTVANAVEQAWLTRYPWSAVIV